MNYGIHRGLCPFVKNPFPECYCFDMTSKNIDIAINYCGNNFQECRIYKKNVLLREVITQKS